MKKLPSSKGIWAPCLTYCEEEDLFYIVYGIMNSMNARYFDVDNYLITSKDIKESGVNQYIYTHQVLMRLFFMMMMVKSGLHH